MKKKLLLFVALLVTVTFNAQTVGATFTDGDYGYQVTSISPLEVTVTGTTSTATSLIIPSTATDGSFVYSVTSLGTNITSTSITTGGGAFKGSALTSMTLPNTVTAIGNLCFLNCASLTTINTDKIKYVGISGIRNCAALTTLNLNSLTSVGSNGLSRNAAITSLSLPAIVTLGDNVFYQNTTQTTITIGSGLTTAGTATFAGMAALATINCLGETPATVTGAFTAGVSPNLTPIGSTTKVNVISSAAETAYEAATGWSTFTAALIIVDSNLATNKVEQKLDFSIYPNPTSGALFIKSNQLENAAVTIYDVNGRVVLNKKLTGSESEINLANEATGVYLINVKTDKSEIVKRIVKK